MYGHLDSFIYHMQARRKLSKYTGDKCNWWASSLTPLIGKGLMYLPRHVGGKSPRPFMFRRAWYGCWLLRFACENSLPFHMHRHENLSSIIWSKSFCSLEVLQICIPKSQKYSLEELSFCLAFLITGQPCRKWVGAYASKYLFTIRKYLILAIKGSTEYTTKDINRLSNMFKNTGKLYLSRTLSICTWFLKNRVRNFFQKSSWTNLIFSLYFELEFCRLKFEID